MYIILSYSSQPCRLKDVTNFRSIGFHLPAVQHVKSGAGTLQGIMQHLTFSVQSKSHKAKLYGVWERRRCCVG